MASRDTTADLPTSSPSCAADAPLCPPPPPTPLASSPEGANAMAMDRYTYP
eukprot:m.67166 g.67166  ORF g.67166 m.67166 type:complete len:51 (+) comp8418_c0_seq2:1639-1791(+)